MESITSSQILLDLLSPEKQIRQAGELRLHELKQTSPNELLVYLIGEIQNASEENVKSLSTVLLKQIIPQVWHVIDMQARRQIKNVLLELLLSRTENWSLIKKITDVVTDLAITIFRAESQEKWPNFIGCIFKSLGSSDNYQVFAGLKVFTNLAPFYADEFSNYRELLFQCFGKSLESTEIQVQAAAIHALTSLISVINTPETMYFIELLQPLLKSILKLIASNENLGEDCIKNLRDLAETEPFYFKSRLAMCFNCGEIVCKESGSIGCKYIFSEFLVVLLEKHCASLMGKKEILVGTCELLKICIEECLGEIDEIEINYEVLFEQLLRRTIEAIGESIVDYLLNTSTLALSSNDWSHQCTALLVLIQIIPEIYFTEKIEILLSAIRTFNTSPQVKIRHVCCNALLVLCNTFPKDFQKRYCQIAVSSIFQGLSDNNDSVINEAAKACKAFVEDCHSDVVKKAVSEFVPVLIQNLNKESTTESALQALQSLAFGSKSTMKDFFPQIFVGIKIVLQRSRDLEVVASAIDCLLAMRKTVKMSEFLIYLPNYLSILRSFPLDSEFYKANILNGWKVLSKYLKSEFTPYLSEIVPELIQSIRNSDPQDIDEYLETILSLIESTSGGFIYYVDMVSELILSLLNSNFPETTRALAASIAGALVVSIRNSGNKEFYAGIVVYSRTFLNVIWKVCAEECDLHTLMEMLNSIQVLIEAPGFEFLTTAEVNQMGEIVLKLLQDQAGLTAQNKEHVQEHLKKTISNILSAIFKSHKGVSLGILEYVYSNVIGKFLRANNNDNDRIFALIIISDIIECVGGIIDPSKLKELAEVLMYYATQPIDKLRYAAVKGITVMCTYIPGQILLPLIGGILTVLDKCINSFDNSAKSAKKVREAAIIAIGKLIKFQQKSLKFEVILPWWVTYLPISIFKDQGREIHDFLADLIINEAGFMAESEVVINLFLSIAFTDTCLSSTLPKITKVLEMFLENKDQNALNSCVSASNKNKLSKLLLS